jgi:tRNA(Ile)-lysidine synthase
VVERAKGLGGPNFEERARQTRYEFLNRTANSVSARFIMLGHHAGDQAETVLLRLLRGTGMTGLSAMAEVGPGRMVRPVLSLSRATILAYLAAIGADFVIDSSNLQAGMLRNRVRSTLLPELEHHYAPGLARRLVGLASEMRETDSFVAAEASRALDTRLLTPIELEAPGRVDVRDFSSIHPALASAMMRELLRRCIGNLRHVERVHIDAMRRLAVENDPSAIVVLPRGWRLRRDYQTLLLERSPSPAEACAMPKPFLVELRPGENLIAGAGLTLTSSVAEVGEPATYLSPWHPPNLFEAYFDAGEVTLLAARSFQPGDRVKPLGLGGSRKVHDLFVDRKVPVAQRYSWPLVVSGTEVLWIPGLIRSRFALVTPLSKKLLHLSANWHSSSRNARLLGL